jgi:hypothetical protein
MIMNAYSRFLGPLAGLVLGLALCFLCTERMPAQGTPQFQQTYLVALQEPVILDVDIGTGKLQILYSRDGQVSLSVSAQGSSYGRASTDSSANLSVEQMGNHITIRAPGAGREQKSKLSLYRLDVPYRTEVVSHIGTGKQEISGIMGPVRTATDSGDTRVSYVSQDVAANAGNGNLDLDVIGGRIHAQVHRGNISCTRAAQGIAAESERGDITLMAIGPSTAKIKEGSGRIELSGARSSFMGSTDGGDIHVKAVVHDDWKMNSKSGNIRIELPSNSSFQLDASTIAGELRLDRNDLERVDAGTHHIYQAVNHGGKRIEASTEAGQVVIR